MKQCVADVQKDEEVHATSPWNAYDVENPLVCPWLLLSCNTLTADQLRHVLQQ
jgi:hypothetical protein